MSSHRLLIENLTVSYNGVPAIHHIDLDFKCGDCVGLLGPNGAGKSTLLKAIVGLVPRESGTVTFHDHVVKGGSPEVAYLPQRENIDWDFPVTVRGMVEMGRYARLGWWRTFGRKDRDAVNRALGLMRMDTLADRQIKALSGGQQQRAFLARSLAQEAHVFLLDEPFAGLDKSARETLTTCLRELSSTGHLIICSHHDLASVPEIFKQVVMLNGELVAAGPISDHFTPDNIRKTFDTGVFTGARP